MNKMARRIFAGLAAAVLVNLTSGCAQKEMETINTDLARSRCLFLAKDKFYVLTPPTFASAAEMQAHERGEDVYEKRFRAQFPPQREDWLAKFQPLGALPETLGPDAAPNRRYYVLPFEDVEPATLQQVANTLRDMGIAYFLNEPGKWTQWPMPPGGSAVRPAAPPPPRKK